MNEKMIVKSSEDCYNTFATFTEGVDHSDALPGRS